MTSRRRIGNVHLSDRSLSWDGNGNPTHISDAVVSSSVNLLHTAQANALQARHYSSSPFLNDINALNTYRAGTDSRSFYYDSLDRLTRLDSRRYGSDRYSYDALGNMRSRQFGGSTRTYSYDSSHNRISSMPGAGALSYDDRGNVSQAGTFTLTRNRANELIGDALGSSFAYDARGWRVKKHVIAGATHTDYFIYDSNHRLMERIDNGTRSDFVYLGQKAIARITNNKPSYIFGDYQNSPLFESNSAGSVTRAPNFVGYGHPDSTGVSEIPGYSGAAPDAETGLLYLGARYLYAERFLSPDPAALDPTSPVGLNRYAYANDNPVRFTDPDGACATDNAEDDAPCPEPIEPPPPPPTTLPTVTVTATVSNTIVLPRPLFEPIPFPWGQLGSGILRLGGRTLGPALGIAWPTTMDAPACELPRGSFCSNVMPSSYPLGYWPGPVGAREWGRRHGVTPEEAARRFHRGVKGKTLGARPDHDFGVNPQTGDVVDPNGESVGNIGDEHG